MDLIRNGQRTDGSGEQKYHGVQSVGRVSFLYDHPLLDALAEQNPTKYGNLKGGVYLTGFKLESVVLNAEGLIDNAKLIPMLNGDTMTLTNACKAGQMTIPSTRTAAGIKGGDLVAVADFIRSQGDSSGGTLYVEWFMNGENKMIEFDSVCVKQCPPIKLAGNDLPDMNVVLTYGDYQDADYPTW